VSRARDIADFNASLFANDEISGDKVSGGTIGAGTFDGTLGSSVTFPGGTSVTGQVNGGHILQVQQKVKTDTFSTGNVAALTTITGFNVAITPSANSSKILIFVSLHVGENQDAFPMFRMYRDSTELTIGTVISPGQGGMFANVTTGNNSRDQYMIQPINFHFLDSPNTTSETTYSIKVRPMSTANRTVFINRSQTIGDANQVTAISTITAMELAG